MRRRARLPILLALTFACGGSEQATAPAPPPSAATSATQEGDVAPPAPVGGPHVPPADRFACETDEDCTLDCALGAVSAFWLSEQPLRATCEDGCAGPESSPPRCVGGACAAFHRDGSPMPACSELDVAITPAPALAVELEPLTRGQSTGTSPNPYVMLRVHNRSDAPQRIQLFAAELWVARGEREIAVPVTPERMDLRSPFEDGEPVSRDDAAWLELVTVPPHATREVTVFTGSLDAAPPNAFPYRLRITFRDAGGGMGRVDAGIQRVIRHPIRR